MPGDEEGGVGSFGEGECLRNGGIFHQELRECFELPDEIGGVEAVKGGGHVDRPDALAEAGPAFRAFAEDLLADEPEAVYAFALAVGDDVRSTIVAFHAQDVEAEELVDRLRSAIDEGIEADWSETTVGGKDVLAASPASGDGQTYLYGTDEMVFFLATTDTSVATEVFEQLP